MTEPVEGFSLSNAPRQLALLPLPVRLKPPLQVQLGEARATIRLGELPERFRGEVPRTDAEEMSLALFQRAEDVWDRLSEVETALADPSALWSQLERLWSIDDEEREPRMDVIVQQAGRMRPVLETLERAPRRILRRTHQMMPISRVQEMDRHAMTWLVRQPGETMAERAGDSQRLLGVAREDNLDTLENRVLRAYLDLARNHAKDYLDRHANRANRKRYRRVREFRAQVTRVDRLLREAAVRRAEPGVTPNYVLLANPRYRLVWEAWRELLRKSQKADELWRWQARSWEEFCALQVMVALHAVPGSRLIAASPLTFRDEQRRGSWIDCVNPLGVFHLAEQGFVVEVQYRSEKPGSWRADLAAPVWVRFGRVGETQSFLKYIAIWPIWSAVGLDRRDLTDLKMIVDRLRRNQLAAAMLLQPTQPGKGYECLAETSVSGIVIGAEGPSLNAGIRALTARLLAHFNEAIN